MSTDDQGGPTRAAVASSFATPLLFSPHLDSATSTPAVPSHSPYISRAPSIDRVCFVPRQASVRHFAEIIHSSAKTQGPTAQSRSTDRRTGPGILGQRQLRSLPLPPAPFKSDFDLQARRIHNQAVLEAVPTFGEWMLRALDAHPSLISSRPLGLDFSTPNAN